MDRWLRDHLVANGTLTETGAGRRAKPRRCRTCNAIVVVGLDDDMCALEVHADPYPLNQAGELLALLDGRATVALATTGRGHQLERRTGQDIAAMPAATHPREDVLREHRCRTAEPPDPVLAPSAVHKPTSAALPPGSPPPF